ncbi:phage tail tape measure protein [Lactobacillus sakei] [Lactiplantibacillus mudanjiangensis]|uniref:phage tail tape measure protein n=1 Tax=Lactiplantibacillus mudanjiangensis TaxID=1296538 RepID=UPI001014B1E5|nr:phage tail tape measure protein [Lactobacillus sakei] [Lactiplantibacillus mudanjiangensis]
MAEQGRPIGSMIVSMGMDGTKFENSLKSIQNQFKLAKSEMRANLSVLSSMGSEYDKAAGKVDGLSKMMDINERKIQSLNETYKKQVEISGDYSDSAMKTASKINDAERVQASFNTQLNKAKIAMNDAERGTSGYRNEVSRISREIDASVSAFKAQSASISANVAEYTGLSRQMSSYNKLIDSEKAKLKDLTSAKDKDNEAIREQETRITELSSKQNVAKSRYDELGKSVGNMTSKTAGNIDSLNRFNTKVGAVGDSVKSAGQSMSGYSLAVGGIFALGIGQASKFQGKIIEIKNLLRTSGESVKTVTTNVSAMTKDATRYSNQYGKSVVSIGEGYEDLVKRGYTSQQSVGAMKSMLQGSIASGDDYNDVIKVSAQTLESFGMRAKTTAGMTRNTKVAVNDLAYAADLTSTGFSDLGVGMSYVGSTAHNAGISLAETSAAMGLLSNSGLESDKAGTGVRKMIISLTSAIDLLKRHRGVLEELGISKDQMVDAHGNLRSLSTMMSAINDKTKGMGTQKKSSVFQDLFGTTGMQAGQILAKDADQLKALKKEVASSSGKNYIGNLANKNMDSPENQLKRFKETMKNTAMAMSETILPVVTSIANAVSNLLGKITSLPAGMRKFASVGLLATAAIGPVLIIIGSLIKAVQSIGVAVSAAIAFVGKIGGIGTIISSPITIAIGVIAGLALAFTEAYKHIKPFHDLVDSTVKSISTGFAKIKAVIKDAWTLLSNDPGSKKSSKATTSLTNVLPTGSLAPALKAIFSLRSAMQSVGKIAQKVFGNIGKFAKSMGQIVSPIFKSIGKVFKSMITGMQSFWKTHGSSILKSFKSIFTSISKIIHQVYAIIKPILALIGVAIKVALKVDTAIIRSALDLIKNIFSSIWNSIGDIVDGALKTIRGIFKIFAGIFTGNWQEVWSGVKDTFKGIWQSFTGIVGGVINSIIGVVNTGLDGINWLTAKFNGPKIKHISTVKWATGTLSKYPNGLPEDQLATVNDGGKRETIVYPNGQAVVPKQMDQTMFLPRGTHVINGDDTEKLNNMHYYASGTGSLLDIIKSFGSGASKVASTVGSGVSSVFSKVKGTVSEAATFIAHPIKALETAFFSNTKLGNMTEYLGQTTKGIGNYVVGSAKNWFQSLLQQFQAAQSDDSGGSGSFAPHFGSPFVKSSGYGPRSGGFHKGIDFAAPLGTKIPAQYSGKVVQAGPASGFGNWVVVDVGPIDTIYGHMKNYKVHTGDQVKAGQTIAWVGSEGQSTGPHVHYELRDGLGGKSYNPMTYGGAGKGTKPSGSHMNWLKQAGFKPSEYAAANKIISAESGWSATAQNPHSSAYGIAQNISPSSYARFGSDWKTNPITQLKWMKSYVDSRYGGANQALAYRNRVGWYAKGGDPKVGAPSIVGEHGAELIIPKVPTTVVSNSKTVSILSKLKDSVNANPKAGNQVIVRDNEKVTQGQAQQIELLQSQNKLLQGILSALSSGNTDPNAFVKAMGTVDKFNRNKFSHQQATALS